MAAEVAALPLENLTGELDELGEPEFRGYLVRSQAAQEIVRILVGLAESEARPEDPVKLLRDLFDAEITLTDEAKEDVGELLAENARLKEDVAAYSSQLDLLLAKIPAADLAITNVRIAQPRTEGEEPAAGESERFLRIQLSAPQPEDDAQTVQTEAVGAGEEMAFEEALKLRLPAGRDAPPTLVVQLCSTEHDQPLATASISLPDADSGEVSDIVLVPVESGASLSYSFALTPVVEPEEPTDAEPDGESAG
uniref:C2 domain-containing protein n=1 Tax=Emiliania huxleyi TaxID=2903 RepID=A0A7S3U293_EMIHU